MENHQKCLVLAVLLSSCILVSGLTNDSLSEIAKTRKALSVFNVIKFPNDPCTQTSGGKNGTCYTASECANKNGVSVGTCANSFGVCCTFTIGCGGTSSENCTFFDGATTIAAGACEATICKSNPNVCSLRLDFVNFVITGPNTVLTAATTIRNGQVFTGGAGASLATECLTDSFSVTGTGSGNPPVICGTNTNQHMYTDASNNCNKLAFQLGSNGVITPIVARSWSIKVTQIPCDSQVLPPAGCTQYFYGSNTGTVQSYNFQATGGTTPSFHLANQNQVICIRKERLACRICYSTVILSDFSVSGVVGDTTKGFNQASVCCGYVTTVKGYDCLMLPGASAFMRAVGATTVIQEPNQFCGHRFATALQSNVGTALLTGIHATICSRQTPFKLSFISDNFEYTAENGNGGFKLAYTLSGTSC